MHTANSSWTAIFDWDGVIVDTSRQHERAWHLLARELGRTIVPGFFVRSFGMKNERVISELLAWTSEPAALQDLSLRKEVLFRELIKQEPVNALPGVKPWLDRLEAAGVRCAVGSSTTLLNILQVIEGIGLKNRFEVIVSAEDVSHGKPDPEVFLVAAAKLGAVPTRCVVFEDAHVGIEAARAAGMRVVAVATTHPPASLQGADLVVSRLDELSVAALAHWFERD
jgi:beta-phosphoglucomutase family hydrolase